MENLSLIAAIGKNRELGLNNRLLWHIPEDLQYYKNMTWGKNIIMGRKTMESMPPKAFEGREIYVLSRRGLDVNFDVNCYSDFNELMSYIKISDREFMVVGGSQIYYEFLPYVDIMYLTEIDKEYVADSFFPYFNLKDWDVVKLADYSYNDINYVRNKYIRKKVK